jgi:hypothetical protein
MSALAASEPTSRGSVHLGMRTCRESDTMMRGSAFTWEEALAACSAEDCVPAATEVTAP